MSETDTTWMREALVEADEAAEHGDVPVGCVIVDSAGAEIARARNCREADADATAHAEIVAVRAACRTRGHWRLDDCTLYVTLEPCAMCAGALINARIGRLVYGATDPKAGAIASLFQLASDSRLNHRFDVTGGVLADASVARLQAFFAKLRAAGEK